MNTANLQLEGLILAVASLNQLLVQKGVATVEEIDLVLRKAEASLTSEDPSMEELKPANRDAVVFPIRVLQMANNAQSETELPAFSELTRMVGQTKPQYNDQR